MGPKKSFSIQNILISIFFFFILCGIGYKYFEWNFLNKLSKLQEITVPAELSLNEKTLNDSQDIASVAAQLWVKDSTDEKRIPVYEELISRTKIALDSEKTYLDLVQKDNAKYEKLKLFSNFLIGKRGILGKKILADQLGYYNNEIQGAKESVIGGNLLLNIWIVSEDKAIMGVYGEKTGFTKNAQYEKYFSDISTLEKYTRKDHKFQGEDEIKNVYPYGYETLQNNKDFMSSFYLIIKDFVSGDYESANYKYSKLQNQFLKLNVDMDKLFSENSTKSQERSKKIIEFLINKNLSIKEFKKNDYGHYPLLPEIQGWKEDIELCQLFAVKASLLKDITEKPIEAKDFSKFFEESEQVSPSLGSVKDIIDKDIIKYINSENEFTFQCTDKSTGKVYIYKEVK